MSVLPVFGENLGTTLGSAYTAGAGSVALASGYGATVAAALAALPGSPSVSSTRPIYVTLIEQAANGVIVRGQTKYAVYKATALSGDTLSGVTLVEGTDQNFAVGDVCGFLLTAAALEAMTTAILNAGLVSSVFGRTGAVVAATGDYSVGQVTGAAPLSSPAFINTPTAPTAAGGTNTTQVATTAFVAAAVSGAGAGSVTSVALALPSSILTVSGSPVTSSGTLTGTLATQTANTVWAGPTTGAAAAPTFRSLVAADLPAAVVLTSGSYADPAWVTSLAGSKVTGNITGNAAIAAGSVTLAGMANLAANSLIGNNTGSPATPLALTAAQTKTLLSLNSVENTALSTWAGSTSITTLGTVATGTWSATTIAIAKGGTGQTTAAAAFNALSPLTTLGDVPYASAANTVSRLAGNTTSTAKYLSQTGTGTVSAAPSWVTIPHSGLTGLTSGDDHTQYALLAGRSGGQTFNGGTAGGDNLTLASTPNASKGSILVNSSGTGFKESTDQLSLGGAPAGSAWRMTIRSDYGWTAIDAGGNAVFEMYAGAREMRLLNGTSFRTYTDGLGATKLFEVDNAGTTSAAGEIRSVGTTDTTNFQQIGGILGQWANSTDATRKGRMLIRATDATASRECIRVESSGSAAMLGFYGATAVAKAAAPTTLSDVITILRNLGLCS